MAIRIFHLASMLPVPASEAFAWHARPGALRRLTPAWEPVEIVERRGSIRDGDRTVLHVGVGPLSFRWIAEHRGYVEDREFRDFQVEGPFRRWEHTHRFEPAGSDGCRLHDRVEYELPLGELGAVVAGEAVRRRLARSFAYRHRVTQRDLRLHARYRPERPWRVLVTGSHGLVGEALVATLGTGGHEVVRLSRGEEGARPAWEPAADRIEAAALEGFDAVVHLAGESIAAGRWTEARRDRVLASRVDGTRLLARALAGLERPPRVLVCASAIGWYGERGDEPLEEDEPAGEGFLADVCRAWEAAADPAREAGIRTVHLRFGMILSPAGGALARMLPVFRLGLGGPLGSGRQYMGWVSLDDAVGAVIHSIDVDGLEGPVNAVSPRPVRHAAFVRTLGRVLRRPALLRVPAAVVRLALGQMGDELILTSIRPLPARLEETGFAHRDPELEGALRHMLGR